MRKGEVLNKIFGIVLVFVMVGAIPLLFFPLATSVTAAPVIPASSYGNVTAAMSIGVNVSPQQTTVGFNEDFDVTIWIDDSLGESYDGVAIRLVYDTSYVTATSVTNAGTFDCVFDPGTIDNTWNATHGLVTYDAVSLIAGPLSTSNPVCTVTFTSSSSNTGIAGLDFIYIPADAATSVTLAGSDILNWTYVINGTVEVVRSTLTVDVSPAGKGDVNINGVIPSAYPNTTSWNSDEVVNLTAVASTPNWTFDHWSGDIGGSDNPTNVTMDSSKSVVAHFARYSLTVANTTGGTVTQPGLGTFRYLEAENVTLGATNYTGYHFVNWTGDVGTIDDVDSATTNITMDGDYSIVANFAINQYNLTINSTAGGDVTTPGEGTFTCNVSEVVVLVAAADASYHFVNWTGDVGTIDDVDSATTNITMDGDYSIVANFAINQYNLTINSTAGGDVTTPGEGTFTCNVSEVVVLVAAADASYDFMNWTGDVGTIGNIDAASTNITMNGNYSIMANFKPSASSIGLNVTPQNTTVGFNENFNVTIWIDDPLGENYDGVAIRLVYNTSYVTATNVTDAGTFDFVLDSGTINNTWNATHGLVKYDATNMGGAFNVSSPVCTVNFRSNGNAGTSGLDFIYIASDAATTVTLAGSDILNWASVVNGTVEVEVDVGATLEGHVSFIGRGSNNTKWIESFNVTLFELGNLSNVLWAGNATTNDTGVFTITGLNPGTYDIRIKNWTCLSELNTNVTLTTGNTTVVDFGTIREGDSNGDNNINILDISLLISAYGSSEGEPDWNPHCDFNRDGYVNILDAVALAGNFGESGD